MLGRPSKLVQLRRQTTKITFWVQLGFVIAMPSFFHFSFFFLWFLPTNLEYIDEFLFLSFLAMKQGRRNSVVVGRDGFKELYMFSPGSTHECYSKYTYICVGQSAVLKPIILGPEDVWRGGQHLHNPNL